MTAPAPPVIAPAVRASRAATLISLLALAALCVAWEWQLAPLRPGGSWLVLKALPLLLPLPGLLAWRLYTFRWVALGVWLYVTEGLVRATSERAPASTLAWLEVLLAAAVFVCCTWHIRLRLRTAKSGQA